MKRIREVIKAVCWKTTDWFGHWARAVWWKVNDLSCDILETLEKWLVPYQEFDPEEFDPENHE